MESGRATERLSSPHAHGHSSSSTRHHPTRTPSSQTTSETGSAETASHLEHSRDATAMIAVLRRSSEHSGRAQETRNSPHADGEACSSRQRHPDHVPSPLAIAGTETLGGTQAASLTLGALEMQRRWTPRLDRAVSSPGMLQRATAALRQAERPEAHSIIALYVYTVHLRLWHDEQRGGSIEPLSHMYLSGRE